LTQPSLLTLTALCCVWLPHNTHPDCARSNPSTHKPAVKMRFLSLAAVGFSTLLHLVASQDLSSLPSCAVSTSDHTCVRHASLHQIQVTCALNAIGATGCAATDAACVCSATTFLSSVQSCISTACNATDQAGSCLNAFNSQSSNSPLAQ
jgi:hypothetical protein